MFKKILAMVLCLVMLGALVACNDSTPAVPSIPDESANGGSGGTTKPTGTTTTTGGGEDNRLWLKVATYNIQHGQDDDPNRTGTRYNLDNMVKVIKDNGIDICGFNEIEINAKRSTYKREAINQPKYIAEKLTQETGEQYYYAYAISGLGSVPAYDTSYTETSGKAAGCNAIVSKYRIVGTPRSVKITLPEDQQTEYYEARVLLIAQIEVEGKILTVISTHFGLTTPEMHKAVDAVLAELPSLQQQGTPVVLMGDFNCTPNKEPITRLKEKLKNTSPGNQITCPKNNNEIDYIFVSKTLQTKNFKVLQYPYSDHLPVVVEILWQ